MIANLKSIQFKAKKEKLVTCSPYDYVKSILNKIPLTDIQIARFDKDYSQWLINRWLLPYFRDIVALNMSGTLPNSFHYKYLFKFVKKMDYVPAMDMKIFKIEDNTKVIMKFYKVDYEEASMLMKYVSKDELKEIKTFYKNNR